MGGRLVVPLRWRGTTRAVAFVKHQDHWASDWIFLCGFVPMLGQHGEHSTTLDPDGLVSLHYDTDQTVMPETLHGVLDRDKTERWSKVTVDDQEPFDRVWLHLSATHHDTVRISADRKAFETGICMPAIPARSPALVDGESLAYLTSRPSRTPGRWHLGAIGHGAVGPQLAAQIVEQINAWDYDRDADPEVLAYPTGQPVPDDIEGMSTTVIKPGNQLIIRHSS